MTAWLDEPISDKPMGTAGRAVLRVAVLAYALTILAFVWLARDQTIATLSRDPIFAGYSIAVVFYVLGRFLLAALYRPVSDKGHRPRVTIIIPAFNEAEGIVGTIRSCVSVDYPPELLQILVVNDGSTDDTWARMVDAKETWPQICAIDLGRNYGKRGAMAEGIRRADGEVIVFVDSDSYLDEDAVINLVQPFADRRIGGVVGHADVRNKAKNWMTAMQAVRYYSAFRVIKGTESMLGGTVICASGCCAAYRTDLVQRELEGWEFQQFLGRPATFGDDRALTSRILRTHKVVYQSNARAETVCPETPRVFFRQQLRWKKSWLRENLYVVRFAWRKNPVAAVFTYASIIFPFMAPFVVVHAVLGRTLDGSFDGLRFYLIGTYAMALLYCLFYAWMRPNGLWFHGITFCALYMAVLVFQTYWGIFTMRDTRWGTRASTVDHACIDQEGLTVLEAARPRVSAEAVAAGVLS